MSGDCVEMDMYLEDRREWDARLTKRWERTDKEQAEVAKYWKPFSEHKKETRHIPDDDNRDGYPLYSGLMAYFPAALMEVAKWSKVGNDKHNPGEKLHWSREKGTDHEDQIARHLLDARVKEKNGFYEAVALAWRSLALLQTILEEEEGRPEGANSKRRPIPGSLDDLREERSRVT